MSDVTMPLLPPTRPRFAPVTRRLLLRRTVAPLTALLVVGLVLTFSVDDPRATAAGLSLLVPGGGLLYTGNPVALVVVAALFGLALVLWWGVSAVLAPWVVLALGVGWSVAAAPNSEAEAWAWAVVVVPAVWLVGIGTAVVRFERTYRSKVASVADVNAFLERAELPEPVRTPVEPSDLDTAALGFMLDLGLQPLDEFAGFDYGEQYHGGTCLRYQLTFIGSALATANANLVPNYPSLIRRAQENIVEKQTDIRVWRYWRLENLLGNLSTNPDPVVRDNIMFSGFLANHLGEFEAATGSDRFDQPGSLTFTWKDGRRFVYDHHSLIEAISRNYDREAVGIFACEPGWVFSICNAMAAQGVHAYDRRHGTDAWAHLEPTWRRGIFEEMMTPDGAVRSIRSSLFGFSFKDGDGTGEVFVTGSHSFAGIAPDMHRRGVALQMRGVPEKIAALEGLVDEDGVLAVDFAPKRERGTRYVTNVGEVLGLAVGARAVGNAGVAAAAERQVERDSLDPTAVFPRRPLHVGVMLLAALMSAKWGSPVSVAELVQRGYRAPVGPVLLDAPWPEVVVAKARCDDGVGLDLVVAPHRARTAGPVTLTFQVARPGPHRLVGPGIDLALEPDADGRCEARLDVPHRLDLRLAPASDRGSDSDAGAGR